VQTGNVSSVLVLGVEKPTAIYRKKLISAIIFSVHHAKENLDYKKWRIHKIFSLGLA